MNAIKIWLLPLAAVLLFTFSASSARADLIRLDDDGTQADPAETFDEDCLGDEPAEDCDTRVALIEGELVTLLSRLESDDDPQTLALFQAALELDSPLVQAMAAQYVSRADQQPDGFFATVRTFFFGPDAPLGVSASAVLQTSGEQSDQQLTDLFAEGRRSSAYAPRSASDELADDELLAACINDGRLDAMPSFSAEERFQPADRLLMYDRFVSSVFDIAVDYPVTAFVTDESLDDVSAFLTTRFGEPYGPVAGSQGRLAELTQQLLALQNAAGSGDQDAIKKLQAVVVQMEEVQKVASLDAYLQLSAIHAENDLVWLDGDIDDVSTQVPRAVTAGKDDALGRNVIRYINAQPSSLSGSGSGSGGAGSGDGNGDGDGDGQAGASAGPGDTPGEGGAADEERATTKSDSGCGCSLPGAPAHGSLAALLLVAAGCALSARKRQARKR